MDFVFGRYLENSIKTQIRESRRKGMHISVRRNTPLCGDFKTFMRDSDNRAELFLMIAIDIVVIVVIAFYHSYDLDVNELWVEYGVGQHKRWLLIHEYAKCLGEEICRAFPFWYAITCCDTVSAFSGRGKKTAWDVWGVFEEATRSSIK